MQTPVPLDLAAGNSTLRAINSQSSDDKSLAYNIAQNYTCISGLPGQWYQTMARKALGPFSFFWRLEVLYRYLSLQLSRNPI